MTNDNTAANEVNKKAAQFRAGPFANNTITTVWASCEVRSFHSTGEIINCSDLGIALLIEWLGYDFTIESLQLKDEIFESVYGTPSPDFNERQQLLAQVQSHFAVCLYCQAINRQAIEEDKLLDNDIGSVKTWLSRNSQE
ncbi:MAG: hypothetical protein WBV94_26160 [Blastocatellia bacterium]